MVNHCQKCNRPVDSGAKGSITQWVFVCRCNLADGSKDVSARISICDQCGKRKQIERKGSLTQWILRADICKCDSEAIATEKVTAKGALPASDSHRVETEDELKFSSDEFPVDRYKPIRQLGTGAHGEVFLSRDRVLQKWVAIKRLHSISSEILIQFQNEARLVSKLHHKNIVQILDFGATENGDPFMVMEYVEGLSLRKWIDENGPFAISDACQIVIEICEALSYAHKQMILHRDITAANVIISLRDVDDPVVKIIDFGIAKIRQTVQEAQEGKDTIAGSPLYMSADQANGLKYDQRSEIYSLGCLFFELLMGKVPFEGETALETISMHAHEEPPSMEDMITDEGDNKLEEIVQRCLAKEPIQRFQSTKELKKAIGEFVSARGFYRDSQEEAALVPSSPVYKRKLNVRFLVMILVPVIFISVFIIQNNLKKKPVVDKQIEPYLKKNRGILPEIAKKSGAFIEGVSDEGGPYTFPVDFLMCTDEKMKELEGRKITNLALWNCPINGSGLAYLKDVPLEIINLDGASIEVENFKYLKPIKTLRTVFLGNTMINTKGLKLIGRLDSVSRLSLLNCSGIDDEAVSVIVSQYPNLESLSLAETPVTSRGFKHLSKLTKLKTLLLERTNFSDKDAKYLINLPLTNLLLKHTPITDKAIDKLARIKSLQVIDVRGCAKVSKIEHKKYPRLRIYSNTPAQGRYDGIEQLY